MTYFKTEHKQTGKIEIYDKIAVGMNSDLQVIEEVSKEENDNNTMQLTDKKEKSTSKNKTNGGRTTRLGYGEDEGERQEIRLGGRK
jgi:hypothetical protein